MPSSVARGGPPGAVTKSPPGGPPAAAGGRGTVRGAPVTATSRGTAPPPGQPQAVGRAAPAVARGAPPAGPPQQVRPPPGATAAQPAGRAVFRADGRGGVAPPGAGRPTAGIAQAMKAVTIGSSGAGSSSARGRFNS